VNKREIVKNQLADLLRPVVRICKEHGIAFVFGFDVSEKENDRVIGYTAGVSPESSNPRITIASLIIQGKFNKTLADVLSEYLERTADSEQVVRKDIDLTEEKEFEESEDDKFN